MKTRGADESAADHGSLLSTASTVSDRIDTAEAEMETSRFLIPGSSIESKEKSQR